MKDNLAYIFEQKARFKASSKSCALFIFKWLFTFLPFYLLLFAGMVEAATPDSTTYSTETLQRFTAKEDQSVYYLESIFGNVGTVLFGQDKLLGKLFELLNSGILFISTIALSYITVISIVNTAREGQILGSKGWSITWIPLRSILGIALVVPGVTGYSLSQEFMMSLTLEGIGAANSVWQKGLEVVKRTGGLNQVALDKQDIPPTDGLMPLMQDLFKAEVCRQRLAGYFKEENELAQKAASPPNPLFIETILPYRQPEDNPLTFVVGNKVTSSTGTQRIVNLCGSFTPPDTVSKLNPATNAPQDIEITPAERKIHLDAAELVMNYYSQYADTFINDIKYNANSVKIPIFENASKIYDNAIAVTRESTGASVSGIGAVTDTSSIKSDATNLGKFLIGTDLTGVKSEVFANAIKDGWIFAGSYYYKLVAPMQVITQLTAGTYTHVNQYEFLLAGEYLPDQNLYDTAFKNFEQTQVEIAQAASKNTNTKMKQLGGTSFPKKGGLQVFWDNSIGFLSKKITESIIRHLTTQSYDPMYSLQKWGTGMVLAAEVIWIATIPIVISAFMATAGPVYNPLTYSLRLAQKILLPLFIAIASLLWSMGALLAFYVPLIPYIVFTTGVLGWFIIVIEAMVAVPLVALGLVAPSKEKFTSTHAALMLIFGVFLRPSLMIIGFFVGARILVAAVDMVNFGFETTLFSAVGSLSLFSPFVIVAVYTGIILTIINRCFGLIHAFPDKILRWLGGAVESTGSQAKQDAQGVKNWAESGIKSSEGLVTSSGTVAQKVLAHHDEKGEKEKEEKKREERIGKRKDKMIEKDEKKKIKVAKKKGKDKANEAESDSESSDDDILHS